MKAYNKLVRDKIPEILTKKNIKFTVRTALDDEYKIVLIQKLREELIEFEEDNSAEELADIIEVILALKKLPEYKMVEEIRIKKAEEKGAFDKKFIAEGEY